MTGQWWPAAPVVTTTTLNQARRVSQLRKDQIIRQELDAARDQVETMAATIRALEAERDTLIDERDRALYERDSARAAAGQ